MKRATTSAEAPSCIYILERERDHIAPYPSILTSQRILLARIMLKCSYRTRDLKFDERTGYQLHNPPVMFNEREITFYTFLHSCDKHAVFFCVCGSHWDFNHNRVM